MTELQKCNPKCKSTLPEQQAAQLYGAGIPVHSVRWLLQQQLEQSLHLGQLRVKKQSCQFFLVLKQTKMQLYEQKQIMHWKLYLSYMNRKVH